MSTTIIVLAADWAPPNLYMRPIEPSPWSNSVYVVGHSAATDTIIPFSLERIEKAMLTSAPFEECDRETEEKLLRYAWGIWRSDEKPETVKLRFTGRRAVRRLRESVRKIGLSSRALPTSCPRCRPERPLPITNMAMNQTYSFAPLLRPKGLL